MLVTDGRPNRASSKYDGHDHEPNNKSKFSNGNNFIILYLVFRSNQEFKYKMDGIKHPLKFFIEFVFIKNLHTVSGSGYFHHFYGIGSIRADVSLEYSLKSLYVIEVLTAMIRRF